jgi:peptide/nickel transport system permease protein
MKLFKCFFRDNSLYLVLRRLSQNKAASVSAMFMLILTLVAILSNQVSPYSPYQANFEQVAQLPNFQHWLGTDELGRDILSRLIFGARTSLLVGSFVQVISTFLGTLIGLISGYYGGIIDTIIMRLVDILYSLPSFLLVIFMITLLTPSIGSIIIILAFINWPFVARLVRGQVLTLKELSFVLAARSLGPSDWHILIRHILPNTLSLIVVQFTLGFGNAIMAEATLSFLGVGIPSPHPSWGMMISKGREYLLSFPHIIIFPCVVLGLTMLSINFLGDGLRDALDPRWTRQIDERKLLQK